MNFIVKSIVIVAFVSFTCVSGSASATNDSSGSDPTPPPVKIPSKQKSQICRIIGNLETPHPQKNFRHATEITEDEALELAFINMEFNSHLLKHPLNETIVWRLLDLIEKITKESCGDFVPGVYLNSARNLFLYYLYRFGVGVGPRLDEVTWVEMTTLVGDCLGSVEAVPLNGDACGVVVVTSSPENEPKDEILDEIIDAVWSMMSITFSQCFSINYPRTEWVVQFKTLFTEDFLVPLFGRWRNPGQFSTLFPLILGSFDFDYQKARGNLRACCQASQAAYNYNQKGGFIRPIF